MQYTTLHMACAAFLCTYVLEYTRSASPTPCIRQYGYLYCTAGTHTHTHSVRENVLVCLIWYALHTIASRCCGPAVVLSLSVFSIDGLNGTIVHCGGSVSLFSQNNVPHHLKPLLNFPCFSTLTVLVYVQHTHTQHEICCF